MLRSFFQEIPARASEGGRESMATKPQGADDVDHPADGAPGIAATAVALSDSLERVLLEAEVNPLKGSTVKIWVTTNIAPAAPHSRISRRMVLAWITVRARRHDRNRSA